MKMAPNGIKETTVFNYSIPCRPSTNKMFHIKMFLYMIKLMGWWWQAWPTQFVLCHCGFMDSCWSCLNTADAKDSVMCTINTISGWPRVGALTDMLLRLNLRPPVIVSSFISPVSAWPSIYTNKQFLSWFYSCSQSVSWFQHRHLTNVTTPATLIAVSMFPWCSIWM